MVNYLGIKQRPAVFCIPYLALPPYEIILTQQHISATLLTGGLAGRHGWKRSGMLNLTEELCKFQINESERFREN
jgi:hypothetical protein